MKTAQKTKELINNVSTAAKTLQNQTELAIQKVRIL
jgi:hypothetical protein